LLEAIALITGFFAIAGIAISLGGIAWLCREETRRSKAKPRMARRAAPPNIWEAAPRAPNRPVRTAFTHSDAEAWLIRSKITKPSLNHHQSLMSKNGARDKLRSLEGAGQMCGLMQEASAQVEKILSSTDNFGPRLSHV